MTGGSHPVKARTGELRVWGSLKWKESYLNLQHDTHPVELRLHCSIRYSLNLQPGGQACSEITPRTTTNRPWGSYHVGRLFANMIPLKACSSPLCRDWSPANWGPPGLHYDLPSQESQTPQKQTGTPCLLQKLRTLLSAAIFSKPDWI